MSIIQNFTKKIAAVAVAAAALSAVTAAVEARPLDVIKQTEKSSSASFPTRLRSATLTPKENTRAMTSTSATASPRTSASK